jgi:hypothetical protein
MIAMTCVIFGSCTILPVGSHFESAKTLEKNQLQVRGNYDRYSASADGDSEKTNYNFGGTVGYGVCHNFDVKLRYERMNAFKDDEFPDVDPISINFIGISPKYMVIEDILSVKLPFNYYFNTESGDEAFKEWAIAPAVLGTLPVNENFDLTGGIQYQHFFENEIENFLGFSLGLGFSSNLEQWAIRPEIGLQLPMANQSTGVEFADYTAINFGIAFLYNFNLIK